MQQNMTIRKIGDEKPHRKQTLGEEIGNAITHGIGFLMGIVAMILLLIKSEGTNEVVAAIIFGIGIMLLYLMSCLYHSFKNGTVVKRIFRRFDHLSIFYLIGGTFAPIILVLENSQFGYIFFIIQWSIIVFGTVFKSIWPTKFLPIALAIYLVLGWSGLVFVPRMIEHSVPLCWFILSGGIAYSIGVVFYAAFKFKYAHFIWHFFCMFGTVLQFLGIYLFIY